ncbi:bactericidal permeability-increasing protein-like isoform X1 [Crassostrea virginica]
MDVSFSIMQSECVCLLTWFYLFLTPTYCKTPGLQTRITDKALNYATNVALDVLSQQVKGQRIPDQHGSSGAVTFDISSMKVNEFTKPSSKVSLLHSVGLSWATTGTRLAIHGNFKYKYKKGIIKISDSGTFDLKTSNINFNIKIKIGMDSSGRPTMQAVGCSCSVGSASIKFHGGAAWIYNLFSGVLEGKLKNMVGGGNGVLCKQLNNLVNVNGKRSLQKLPVTVKLAKWFLLDYRFLSQPSFQSTFMETYHKGEVYWNADPVEAPFAAPPLLKYPDTSRMMYIWLSDFLFNSMSYNAFKYNRLQYNVTKKDLPSGVLNTTCPKSNCIGKMIKPIGTKFPNTTIMLYMKSTSMPNMTVQNGSTVVNAVGDILFFAEQPNGKYTYILTLSATMSTTISLTIQKEKVFAKVLRLPIDVKVKESNIPVSAVALNFIVKGIVSVFVEPKLNDLGQAGFPLPVISSIHFVNTKLTVAQDTLLIATDLKYTG